MKWRGGGMSSAHASLARRAARYRSGSERGKSSSRRRPVTGRTTIRPASGPTIVAALVAVSVVIGGGILTVTGGPLGLVGVIVGLVCLAGSFAILRLTPEAKLQRKKLQAFRRYLKTAHQPNRTGVGERIGDYLVYGLALGVGTKTIEHLFGTPVRAGSSGVSALVCA